MRRTLRLSLSVSMCVVAACGSNSAGVKLPGGDGGLESGASSSRGSGSSRSSGSSERSGRSSASAPATSSRAESSRGSSLASSESGSSRSSRGGSSRSSRSSSESSSAQTSGGSTGADAGACGGTAGEASVFFAIAGYNDSQQVDTDGSIFSWGYNIALGTGNLSYQLTPAQVPGCGWAKLALGDGHTLAVRKDGTLWSWGENGHGQLGYDTSDQNVLTPQQVGSDTNWASVAAGAMYSLAIKTDGTLWAWGDDSDGQLGLGQSAASPTLTPTQVGADTHWASVSANYTGTTTAAIKADGTLWAWGKNDHGQVGDGTGAGSACNGNATFAYCVFSPEKIGTATTWASVSVGTTHALAIKTDGSLWGWGSDDNNEIGDGSWGSAQCNTSGDANCVDAPVRVGSATSWASVSAGTGTSHGVQTDGSLWGWGFNLNGQVGDGTNTGTPCDNASSGATYCVKTPERIGTGSSWAGASSGNDQTVAWKTDGSVWSWGGDSVGEVGNGVRSSTGVFSPVKVP